MCGLSSGYAEIVSWSLMIFVLALTESLFPPSVECSVRQFRVVSMEMR